MTEHLDTDSTMSEHPTSSPFQDRTNRDAPSSSTRKRKLGGSVGVGINREDVPHGLNPLALEMNEEDQKNVPEVLFTEAAGIAEDGKIANGVSADHHATGVSIMSGEPTRGELMKANMQLYKRL